MFETINEIKDKLLDLDKKNILGIAVYGSFNLVGFRVNSDLNLLVLTEESISEKVRRELTVFLLETSGDIKDQNKPCIELTIFNFDDNNDFDLPLRCDYM